MDSETRRRIQEAENKRLYREALKKKLEARNQQENALGSEEGIQLPSFAFVNKLGLIQCAICGEEFSSKLEFVNHLTKSKHLKAIEKIKMQIQMKPDEPAPEVKNLLQKREQPEELAIQDPNEKEQDPEYFLEKNEIKLPAGFFDDAGDADQFQKEENVRLKKLMKQEGFDSKYVTKKDQEAIDDI